jgi:integrase
MPDKQKAPVQPKQGPGGFTERYLRELQPPPEGEFSKADRKTTGLTVRVFSGGIKLLGYKRRDRDGRLFKEPFGRWPGFSLKDARKRAEKLNGERADDKFFREAHPNRRARRLAKAGVPTLQEVLNAWDQIRGPKMSASHRRTVFRGVPRVFAPLLPLPINGPGAATYEQYRTCWEALRPTAQGAASQWVYALLNFAVGRFSTEQLAITNPLSGRPKPEPGTERQDHLTGEQMLPVYDAAGDPETPRLRFVQFLMLTLVRRAEAAGARWDEFNSARTEWIIPAERMKGRRGQQRAHFVPLSPAAQRLLQEQWRTRTEGCPFVFPSEDSRGPINGFGHLKRNFDRLLARQGVKLPEWHLHDLRRSGATFLARAGFDDVVVELLLAHQARGKVPRTYNLYQREAERRAALERLGAFLAGDQPIEGQIPVPQKSLPAPSQSSIPTHLNGEEIEELRRGLELATEEAERADMRTLQIARMLNHPDMPAFKEMVRKRKHLAGKFAHRDIETVTLLMAWVLADLKLLLGLLGTNEIFRRHVVMLCDSWVIRQDRCRERVRRHRQDAQQAEDRGRASWLEAMARQAELDANVCGDMIEGAERYLKRLGDGEIHSDPADWPKVLTTVQCDLTAYLFTKPAPELSAKLVRMAAAPGATRDLIRRRPEGLPPPPPQPAD